jgi:hypothetical protein
MNKSANKDDEDSNSELCKFHPYNQIHILCETCNELICDKCEMEDHKQHKREKNIFTQNADFIINIFTSFYNKMKKIQEESLKNFKGKIDEVDKTVDIFFHDELIRVEKASQEVINILTNLNIEIKKLISIYQQKFRENFINIKSDFDRFENEILNLSLRINAFKVQGSTSMKRIERFKEFKDFKLRKLQLETDSNKLLGYYDFNKTALISEFSMKDFYSFLEKNKVFLMKHYEEYRKTTNSLNVEDKINSVVGFDEEKMIFSSKNFLPRNISKIFQPIDRTNQITIYDSETEKFKRISLLPKNLEGFTFLPFSRYINFNGRLLICGGYEDQGKLSRTTWAFEDRSNLSFWRSNNINSPENNKKKGGEKTKTQNTNSITSSIEVDFYNNINENYIFEDMQNSNYNVIRLSNMIQARAGHSLVSLPPTLILAFSGTESNKTCEMFHFGNNRWEEIASLNTARIDPSAITYKNYVYVFFGLVYHKQSKKYSFLDSIERISLMSTQSSEWQFISPKLNDSIISTLLPRSLCGIVVKNNSNSVIYLLGGQVDKDKFSSQIFEYNLDLNTLSITEKKLQKPTAFLEQNFVYLFKTGINFDIYGDVFYYQSHNDNDTFNFHFQDIKKDK